MISNVLPRMPSSGPLPNEHRATDALSFSELLKHPGSVHVAAGTAIDDDYLFHFLLCFNLFDYSAWIADSHHI